MQKLKRVKNCHLTMAKLIISETFHSYRYASTIFWLKIYRKRHNNGWISESCQRDTVQELPLIWTDWETNLANCITDKLKLELYLQSLHSKPGIFFFKFPTMNSHHSLWIKQTLEITCITRLLYLLGLGSYNTELQLSHSAASLRIVSGSLLGQQWKK